MIVANPAINPGDAPREIDLTLTFDAVGPWTELVPIDLYGTTYVTPSSGWQPSSDTTQPIVYTGELDCIRAWFFVDLGTFSGSSGGWWDQLETNPGNNLLEASPRSGDEGETHMNVEQWNVIPDTYYRLDVDPQWVTVVDAWGASVTECP